MRTTSTKLAADFEAVPHLSIVQKPEADKLSVLSSAETDELKSLEEIIGTRMRAFLEVGRALCVIKAKRLYRSEFSSFEAYCKAKWDLNRSHAYRLVDAAEVCEVLSPMGDRALPENERQIRPLVGLSAKAVGKIWKRVLEKAGPKGPISGALVRRTALELTGKTGEGRGRMRENWEIRITPLLQEAQTTLRKHDKEGFAELIHKISLFLMVGERPVREACED